MRAPLKEAMVKAQAKLRSAKEFMDRKMSKIVDECDSLRDEGLQSSCDREDNGMKFSVREEKQKVMTAQEVLDSVGEKLLKVAKESAEKRLGKKSSSYLDKSDKALEQTNHVQISVHNTKILERGQKEKIAVMGVFDQQLRSSTIPN
uniref:Uncharacterized protein n=1 Tax=Fagus sylvatica TaxID=28930 RepID=A0A2N9JBB2_FAGSY